jgi:hypothetical protein
MENEAILCNHFGDMKIGKGLLSYKTGNHGQVPLPVPIGISARSLRDLVSDFRPQSVKLQDSPFGNQFRRCHVGIALAKIHYRFL